jgi:hypothetical protein
LKNTAPSHGFAFIRFHTLKERLQNPVIIFDIGLFSSGFKTVLIKLPARGVTGSAGFQPAGTEVFHDLAGRMPALPV